MDIDIKNLESIRYNKYYNRSGVVLWFHRKIGDIIKTYFIFTVSKYADKFTVMDFGGQRDQVIGPVVNMFREYIEESTYSDPAENPVDKGIKYAYDNNILQGPDFEKFVQKINNQDYMALYNEFSGVNNYLYLVYLDELNALKWGGVNYNLDNISNDGLVINIEANNYHNEIHSIWVVDRNYMFKNRNYAFRYLISDTLTANHRMIDIIDKYYKSVLLEPSKVAAYQKELTNYTTVPWEKCPDIVDINAHTKNDTTGYTFECVPSKTEQGFTFIELPAGYNFYKAMKPTDLASNINITNTYATSPTWYGDLDTAFSYIPWGLEANRENWRVYAYKLVTPVKLILLMDGNNIKYLYDKILATMKQNINKHSQNKLDQAHRVHVINGLDAEIRALRLTTGYRLTFASQLKLLDKLGLHGSILKRKKQATDKFIKDNRLIRYCLKDTCFSDLYYDLDRISPLTAIDRQLVKIICKYTNFDGYYIPTVPSLWHLGYKFHAEIALCFSRHIMELDTENVYNDTNSEAYKKKFEDANKKYMERKLSSSVINYIYIDFDAINAAVINYVKKNYSEYHFMVITDKKTDAYNEVIESLKKSDLYNYVMTIHFFINNPREFIVNSLNKGIHISAFVTQKKMDNIEHEGKTVKIINI
jgi:hypothetical protein